MIDTIKIKIKGAYISTPEYFTPEYKIRSYDTLSNTEKKSNKTHLNVFVYKSSNKKIYMPSVRVYEKLDKENKIVYSDISVEFSVPKLLYENNLLEVSEDDVDVIVSTLINKLRIAGINIFPQLILNSVIRHIHFGKNIFLPEDITMKNIIDKLRVTSMGKSFDSTYREFKLKNIDQLFHFYNSSREYVIYDKIRDILNTKNKSQDKYKTEREMKIIDEYQLKNKEVFRFEYRLKHHTQIKSEINSFLNREPMKEIIFKDVFNDSLCSHIINKSWSKILDRDENNLALIFNRSDLKNKIRMILNNSKEANSHNLNKILITFGLGYISMTDSIKFFRKECARKFSNKTVTSRLDKKIKESLELLDSLEYPEDIEYVSTHLREFKRINISDLLPML